MSYIQFLWHIYVAITCNPQLSKDIRELKKNSQGRRRQRRQNNKTKYTRQKAHVNMWNKADIGAVLLSTLSAKRGQYISTIIVDLLV